MLDRSRYGTRKFPSQMPNHLRDDLDPDEVLAVVNAYCEVYHLRQNNHVTAVCTNDDLAAFPLLFSRVAKLDEQFLLTRRQTAFEGPSPACWEQFNERVHIHLD